MDEEERNAAAMDDEPLDFEAEDQLLAVPPPSTKRRRVIGLDDLLSDFYKERSKFVESKSKRPTVPKGYNSDEEDDDTSKTEREISKLVDECQRQVNKMATEEEIPLWGLKIFRHQKPPPPLNFSGVANCELLQSITKTELNSVMDLNFEQGESFLEGLLMNGWLLKLAFVCGFVDESIASWTFYKMLYSSNEELQVSACNFWCEILLPKNVVDQPSVRIGWFPNYSQLKDALETYGYQSDDCSLISEAVHMDSEFEGPPQNIISWIKVLSACYQVRSFRSIFSTSEAEDLLVVIIRLLLDRQLQGLSFILHECMQSAIGFFSEIEWDASCKKVAYAAANRVSRDLNCIRIVECISGTSRRSKHLRSQVAIQILLACFDRKVAAGKEILELLISMNVKDPNCDFFKLYIYLVLAENWLSSYHSMEERSVLLEMWYKYLRTCSSQITSTDWRSYASKVRNKASYLLQNSTQSRIFE